MTREITLLTDYKGEFYCPHKRSNVTTDLDRLDRHLRERGYHLSVRRFTDLDFRRENFRDRLVLYQSSQDVGLYYKDFIEDVVLGLQHQGARLIPPFHLFRAHHNKVFMEILRDLSPVREVRTLRSKGYGTYEEFVRDLEQDRVPLPAVIKIASGDSGSGVALVHSRRQARRVVRDLTLVLDRDTAWKNFYRTVFTRGWHPDTFHRRKFIVQEYVPGLDHDWKTIAFGPKYFVSVRPTRPGDFRASGSRGERTYPTALPEGLLDFLEAVFTAFKAPYASIDVMHDGRQFYLGEIQFIRFGTGAVIRCPHHWRRQDGRWARIDGRREWEPELAECLADYINHLAIE